MRDIPALLEGYTFMVSDEPEGKVRELDDGRTELMVDRETGEQPFSVLLFAKLRREPGTRSRKDGEEIKVNLPRDPGEGFGPGTYVELLNPVLNTYEMRGEDGKITNAGIWWKADGLKPVVSGARSSKRGVGEAKPAGADSGEAAA